MWWANVYGRVRVSMPNLLCHVLWVDYLLAFAGDFGAGDCVYFAAVLLVFDLREDPQPNDEN